MNDEIKRNITRLEELRNSNYIFSTFDVGMVLDYITNLQHQISLMEEDIRESKEINGELQQDNERLKQEYINVRNYIKMRKANTEVEDKALLYNMELENINKKKYLDYKSRCEKAIDKLRRDYYTNYSQHNDDVVREALNILQNGSDDNE